LVVGVVCQAILLAKPTCLTIWGCQTTTKSQYLFIIIIIFLFIFIMCIFNI
jgi:hypothetical protein